MIAGGNVLVNGARQKSHYRLRENDIIDVSIPRPGPAGLKAEKIPLNIIHEDSRIIVVDKPAGMVIHPAVGNFTGTLVNALLYHQKTLSGLNAGRPGIVHRLDKETSGLVVAAKDDAAHAYIGRQFTRRQVEKTYMAVVEGVVRLENGTIEAPVGRHPVNRQRMAVLPGSDRYALTGYKVIRRFAAHTLVEFTPHTGRTHQIRVHAAHMGHPIVGDALYGKRAGGLIGRQALHAARLGFHHPETRKMVYFESPLPEDMKRLIAALEGD